MLTWGGDRTHDQSSWCDRVLYRPSPRALRVNTSCFVSSIVSLSPVLSRLITGSVVNDHLVNRFTKSDDVFGFTARISKTGQKRVSDIFNVTCSYRAFYLTFLYNNFNLYVSQNERDIEIACIVTRVGDIKKLGSIGHARLIASVTYHHYGQLLMPMHYPLSSR